MLRLRGRLFQSLLVVGVVVSIAACGSGSGSDDAGTAAGGEPTTTQAGPVQNACPVDGCTVHIDKVEKAGKELKVTWTTNYRPDVSRNHIHVYWDLYTPDQVSNDAASRGVEQGSWHPTDDYPTYVTGSEASTSRRGTSTKLCVTAGDRNHDVIDARLFECTDVKALL